MARCSVKKCNKAEIGDSGLCYKHGGRVVVVPTRMAVFQTTDDKGRNWNQNQSAQQMRAWLGTLVGSAQKTNVPAMISAMQDGYGNNRRVKASSNSLINGGITLYHASQGADGKAGCLTVFWVEYTSAVVTPVAIGAHDGSSSYVIGWRARVWPYGSKLALSQV